MSWKLHVTMSEDNDAPMVFLKHNSSLKKLQESYLEFLNIISKKADDDDDDDDDEDENKESQRIMILDKFLKRQQRKQALTVNIYTKDSKGVEYLFFSYSVSASPPHNVFIAKDLMQNLEDVCS